MHIQLGILGDQQNPEGPRGEASSCEPWHYLVLPGAAGDERNSRDKCLPFAVPPQLRSNHPEMRVTGLVRSFRASQNAKLGTRLHMGAKCGKVICCGLWRTVQHSNQGCYSLSEQSSGVGSREARLPTINGWQVREKSLTAYTFTFLQSLGSRGPGGEPLLLDDSIIV